MAFIMTVQIINTELLPALIMPMILSEKVRVRESNNVITIEPVDEKATFNCPLLGAAAGSKLTVSSFLAMTREDKELETW